jgi:predicted NACHT family NTPase
MTIEKSAFELVKILLKWGWDKTSAQIDKIDFTDSSYLKLFDACQEYIQEYRDRYGEISIFKMPRPAELEKIYTRVKIVEPRNTWRYGSLEEEHEEYRSSGKRSLSENGQKYDGICIANQYQYLVILGQPGAGKSTFLKRIGLAALQRTEKFSQQQIQSNLIHLNPDLKLLKPGSASQPEESYNHGLFPVLIELKDFNNEKIDLLTRVTTELDICGFKESDALTKKLLEKGGMLILLDGLDEVSEQHFNVAIEQIKKFVNRYKYNRFIISCRTAAYHNYFNKFAIVKMADFDNEQIYQFIDNWFCKERNLDSSVAEAFWQQLNTIDHQATKELAQTPLLLTFLCIVYDATRVFPKNRSALYTDVLDIILRRWAREKGVHEPTDSENLSIEQERMLLAEIAYEQFSQEKFFFNTREIINKIHVYIESNINTRKYLDAEKVLRSIQIQEGILVERSSSILSFSHLTLQEYLAAQYIVDNHLTNNLVGDHFIDDLWREVFLLVAGLLRDRKNNFLSKMAVSTSRLINTQKLRTLVKWGEGATITVSSKVSPLAQRNLALLLVYANAYASTYANTHINSNDNTYCSKYANSNAYAYAEANTEAYAYAIANSNANFSAISITNANAITIQLIENLSELEIFTNLNYSAITTEVEALTQQTRNKRQSEYSNREFSQQLVHIWCKALSIELDWLNLSELEIRNLDQYFTANLLIMECKEVTAYISPEDWAEVEELMFRVILPKDDW